MELRNSHNPAPATNSHYIRSKAINVMTPPTHPGVGGARQWSFSMEKVKRRLSRLMAPGCCAVSAAPSAATCRGGKDAYDKSCTA